MNFDFLKMQDTDGVLLYKLLLEFGINKVLGVGTEETSG
eukprot:SAG11_NODE_85_length_17370_cov_29.272017_8_plen_39_part_00